MTSISAVPSGSTGLVQRLQAAGLSADKARLVQDDVAAAAKSAGGITTSATPRAAIDARIAADVQSGKLSDSDAAAVKKTLDDLDGTAATPAAAATATAAPAATAGGTRGGGGGGGTAAKTEVSEVVTIAGSTKTTVITYSDKSTATTTTTATQADKLKYDKQAGDAADAATADAYLATIEPGTLVDREA